MRHIEDFADRVVRRHAVACPFAAILTCLAWLIVSGWSGHAAGQENSGDPPSASAADQVAVQQMREKAALLFRKKDWLAAAKAYDDVCKSDPDDAIAWYRRGYALHALEDDVRAMEAHERAAKVDSGKAKALYNLACALTLTNRSEEALDALERAAKAGFSDARLLKTDSDLASIRNHPRFVRLIEKVAENSSASDRPELRQFDFWVGDWDVFNAKGVKVGANKIELLLGGHLIQETWTSAKGGTGRSLNYFDPKSGTWKQNWVDDSGGIVRYEGSVKDGAMHFSGESINPKGEVEIARVTLQPLSDGRVHHLIEHSKDGGKTWYTYFDGTYVRKK